MLGVNGYADAEIELMKQESERKFKLEKRRIELEEARLRDALKLREQDMEMRRMTLDAQKARTEALAAIANKLSK